MTSEETPSRIRFDEPEHSSVTRDICSQLPHRIILGVPNEFSCFVRVPRCGFRVLFESLNLPGNLLELGLPMEVRYLSLRLNVLELALASVPQFIGGSAQAALFVICGHGYSIV
jgi:hypothetical protein